MSAEAVSVTNEDAARRRIGATAALAALVVLLALISLGIGPVRLSPVNGDGGAVRRRAATWRR